MADPRTRERIIELVRQMREHTVAHGCTPGEAAKFAAKVAELVERHQIGEAELRAEGEATAEELEVVQNKLQTGKRAFNPGMTAVINALAQGMCCKIILLHEDGEAVYGVVGDSLDCDYVCQVATMAVPALQTMAKLDGAEHGYEKAGLVRWSNQYLTGAGEEILKRLEAERKARSDAKTLQHKVTCSALVLVTGLTLAAEKRAATEEAFKRMYPVTRTMRSKTAYNDDARRAGREAGKRVGLHVGIE